MFEGRTSKLLLAGHANPAAPSPDAARLLRRSADSRLIASLAYLCDVVETQGRQTPSSNWKSQLEWLQETVNSGSKLRSVSYALHNEVLQALKENDEGRAVRLIDAMSSLRLGAPGEPEVGCFRGETQAVEEWELLSSVLGRENRSAYQREFDAGRPASASGIRSVAAIEHCLAVLDECDPQTALELRAVVSEILVITSNYINAGTSFRTFGLILVQEAGEKPWTTYLEELVHEAAHLYLYLLWTEDSIILGDDEATHPSPLRSEARPMSAVFHAMFVLARTVRCLRIVGRNERYSEDISSMPTRYNYANNPDSFESKFDSAYDTVANNALLTPFGEELLSSTERLVRGPVSA
jgi:HEXXH motif-containing protein